jgi:hypothetical protein
MVAAKCHTLSAPTSFREQSQALMFILTLGVRMEGCFWISMALSSWYCLFCGVGDNAFLLYAAMISFMSFCLEANTEGILPYGTILWDFVFRYVQADSILHLLSCRPQEKYQKLL